jgi:hypothetical protein
MSDVAWRILTWIVAGAFFGIWMTFGTGRFTIGRVILVGGIWCVLIAARDVWRNRREN